MDADLWRRTRRVFEEAAALPPQRRDEFIHGACGEDAALLKEVRSLLDHDLQASASFLCPPEPPAPGRAPAAPDPLIGERIDQYTIRRVIGHGGMGVVYLAEQQHPEREVALKVVQPRFVSPATLRRFGIESQALGRLQHPGIAQIFEAGTFDTGEGLQPFFAMEHIKGASLVEYADTHVLSSRGRLELMIRICDAVHHAHQKFVIHRDLKPSNILVDETGQPKILDFGVARVTDSDLKSSLPGTSDGQLVGTLPYMSPEQAAGASGEIDARSDIYTLGEICYELLAGRLPHDLAGKAAAEQARVIRDEDPPPLSSVSRDFRGDLDTIVRKAMDKDKERRYPSASELGNDIRRYLRDEPVSARPPSAAYQVRKFARRNKALVAGLAVAFVGLAIGLAAATWQAISATQARGRLEVEAEGNRQIVKFLLEDMLSAAQPSRAQGADLRVRDVLDEAAARVSGAFPGTPAIEAMINYTIGLTYEHLALYPEAEPHLVGAYEALRDTLGDDDRATLAALAALGAHRTLTGDPAAGEALLRRTRVGQLRTLGEDNPETLYSAMRLGEALRDQNRLAEAEEYVRGAIEGFRRLYGDENTYTLAAMYELAGLLRTLDRREEAVSLMRTVLEARRRLGPDDPDTIGAMDNLALFLQELDRLDEAEPLARAALEAHRRQVGDDHGDTVIAMHNLGIILARLGRFEEAEALLRDTVARAKRVFGPSHWWTVSCTGSYAACLFDMGRFEDAEPLMLECYRAFLATFGDKTHPSVQMAATYLAEIYERLDRPDDAAIYQGVLATP